MKLFENGFLSQLFTNVDVGIDLGTANLLLFLKEKGIVFNEPSVVAIDKSNGKVVAVGRKAHEMLGKTPDNIKVIHPLSGGVVADYEATQGMLSSVLTKIVGRNLFFKPRVMVCVPTGITNVERRAVKEACIQAGAAKAFLIEEPLAAAIGAGIDVQEPMGHMVVNIGGGTTDAAVISLGSIVASSALRIGGSRFDEAIVRYMKKDLNIQVGEDMAEDIKKRIGTVSRLGRHGDMAIRGRDMITGLPTTLRMTSRDTMRAMTEPVGMILGCIQSVFEKTPPQLAADILETGIILTGGGALLEGLADVIQSDMHVRTKVAENPLECVVRGAGQALDNPLVMEMLLEEN
ncbi:MAG: rod shape-determining protein [Acidaminococcus sp.]|jgi:rod shape-determining protein MreB|nr:rod shape-determining protein [Acidaminococcus sp.]MCI2099891.1 rod shape-determining protein [Acidaminococcus sp.]MCI2114122.1 rod shape-determining protein [Acidaminococcus sp.]MCI2116062.1 rod shape-determining protein [Acidaminococcus sp.]